MELWSAENYDRRFDVNGGQVPLTGAGLAGQRVSVLPSKAPRRKRWKSSTAAI